jgi:hypothetical protein
MDTLLLLAEVNRMWYSVPLIVVISLVYGATRHELPRPIIEHALRFGAWLVGFMAILFVVLWLVTRRL